MISSISPGAIWSGIMGKQELLSRGIAMSGTAGGEGGGLGGLDDQFACLCSSGSPDLCLKVRPGI